MSGDELSRMEAGVKTLSLVKKEYQKDRDLKEVNQEECGVSEHYSFRYRLVSLYIFLRV